MDRSRGLRAGIFGLLVAGAGLGTAGCAAPAPTDPGTRLVEAGQYDQVCGRAIEVLRDRGFTVDRQDRRFGTFTTDPSPAATALEPWRPNTITAASAAAATFNDLRRTVTVTLSPADATPDSQAATYRLAVEVLVERRQDPTRRVGGALGNEVFSQLAQAPVELSRRGIDGPYWLAVGRDTALERRILDQILDAAGPSTGG